MAEEEKRDVPVGERREENDVRRKRKTTSHEKRRLTNLLKKNV